MSDENKKIIEINGIKMEVDLREVKIINHYKVGDNVKILLKKYSDYKVYPGVITGFVEFNELPTIEILYVDHDQVNFCAINEKTEGIEVAPYSSEELMFGKELVIEKLDDEINRKEIEVKQLKQRRAAFLKYFQKYFEPELVEIK